MSLSAITGHVTAAKINGPSGSVGSSSGAKKQAASDDGQQREAGPAGQAQREPHGRGEAVRHEPDEERCEQGIEKHRHCEVGETLLP